MLWMTFMTMQPPDRPGTGWLAYSIPYGRQAHSWTMPKGGSTALPQALARCIEAHGGVVLTRKPVVRLLIEGGRCVGVETKDGAAYRARHAVLSTIHIKHLVEMAPKEAWGEEFLADVGSWEAGVSMFVTHYATTVPPQFPAGQGTILGSRIGSTLGLERLNRHNWHGSCHGGDMSPAQSGHLRPVPGWAQHRLPIPGLYQTGATTHPGGSVSAAPGRNAAIVLLRD